MAQILSELDGADLQFQINQVREDRRRHVVQNITVSRPGLMTGDTQVPGEKTPET